MEIIRVLSVEDDARITRLLRRHFAYKAWPFFCSDGERFDVEIVEFRPDVVLLDWNLAHTSGPELLEKLRASSFRELPVIMLSAVTSEKYVVEALHKGADDYIRKPFLLTELDARIVCQFRRSQNHYSTFSDGQIHIRFSDRTLEVFGDRKQLGAQEWKVMEVLVRSPYALSRREIGIRAWGEFQNISDAAVDKVISRLRKVIGDQASNPKYLKSIRGIGYQFAS